MAQKKKLSLVYYTSNKCVASQTGFDLYNIKHEYNDCSTDMKKIRNSL